MENQKQEVKQEVKEVTKLCPFISGFLLEMSRISVKENGLFKTTNVAPCLKGKCMFYNATEDYCKIVKGLDDIHNSFEVEDEQDEEEQTQGEGTDNE